MENNIEEKLKKLEEISAFIKQNDISLEDALKNFEEGIKLAKGLEAEISNMEGKIQKLMNMPAIEEDSKDSKEDVSKDSKSEKKASKKKTSKSSKTEEVIKAPRSDEELELSLFTAPELEC